MDQHFDELTRAMAKPLPRRRALLLMAGSMVGALLGLGVHHAGAATCSQCTCWDDGNGHYYCIDQNRKPCPNCKGCSSENDAGKVCS